jgi:hypothetical protein
MSQMQDGFRQRLGRRASLLALQEQLRLAYWLWLRYARMEIEINASPWFIEPALRFVYHPCPIALS